MPLINIPRMEHLVATANQVDAGKVLTDIQKPGENAGFYNVNESLAQLAKDIQKETDARKDVNKDFEKLKQHKIKDMVRLQLDLSYNNADLPDDLDILVPGLDKTKPLPVYKTDNSILYDEEGNQLTIDMNSGALSGKPCVLDEDATAKAKDGKNIYKEADITTVKIFPIGEWSLGTLPAEALLDNDELQVIAYKDIMNKLVVDLARDENILTAVQERISSKAIDDAIAGKADVTDLFATTADGKKVPLFRQMSDKIQLIDLDKELSDDVATFLKTTATVDKLSKNYDAKLVTTAITKADTTPYNIEELAEKMMKDIDDNTKQASDARNVIDEKVSKLKKMVQHNAYISNVQGSPEWETAHQYYMDDIVKKDDAFYLCRADHISTELDADKEKNWIQLPKDMTVFGYAPALSQVSVKVEGTTEEKKTKETLPVQNVGVVAYPPIYVLKVEEDKASWAPAEQGKDFTYHYINGQDLEVTFLVDGSYKINYCAGITRG